MNRLGILAALATLVSSAALSAGCTPADVTTEEAAAEQNAEAPAFLPPSAYGDLVAIDPSFPFGVTRRHAAKGAVLGARWGRHGGPLVTTHSWSAPADPASVTRWSLPAATDAPAEKDVRAAATPSGMPGTFFWGVDGLVDLPFGPSLAMQAYTGSGLPFAGEVLFYTADYDRVVARAHVNGWYSGVGVREGTRQRIVYSSLSALSAAPGSSTSNGLYATDVCGEGVAGAGCGTSVQLFSWSGFSGPVVTDGAGNVFVAAFSGGGVPSDTVYALAKTKTFAAAAVAPVTVVQAASGGTSSLAALLAPGASAGWVVAKGYDGEKVAPVYAQRYTTAGGDIAAAGAVVPQAIAITSATATLSMFSDDAGHLWLALEDEAGGWLLELQAKP